MSREVPQNVPLTALLSNIAIAGAFAEQPVTGDKTPQEFDEKMQRAVMGSGVNLFKQELTFYHGIADVIEADYRRCGFLSAFEQDVQSGKVFDPSITTIRDAIEARVGSFWQKMMYDTPAGIIRLKGDLETGYRRCIEQGVQAGVELNGQVIHNNRLVETVICMHHMVGRVAEMLQRGGYDISLLQG